MSRRTARRSPSTSSAIYTMPIAGGAPTRPGLAYEHQPRFSPDGKRIAFVSDRGGGDNIWIMNRDGSDKRQPVEGRFPAGKPSWSPDGEFIVARSICSAGRSLGTGEVWLYHVSGGAGVPLVKRPNERHQEGGRTDFRPTASMSITRATSRRGRFSNMRRTTPTCSISGERYNLDTGEVADTAIGRWRRGAQPPPLARRQKLAFVRREGAQSSSTSSRIGLGRREGL